LPWVFSALSAHLPVQEVLLLWDRVLGLDSLLPLLAAVIKSAFSTSILYTYRYSRSSGLEVSRFYL
jgi:hypothetical protein